MSHTGKAESSLFCKQIIHQLHAIRQTTETGSLGPKTQKIVENTTPAHVDKTRVGIIHKAIIAAAPEALAKLPIRTRVTIVDKVLRGALVSYDDEAAISKIVCAQPKEMVLALHEAGLLGRALDEVYNHGTRCGILGLRLGRDFPSKTMQDIRHWSRMKAAIVNTHDEEVALAVEGVGHSKMAAAIRGGARSVHKIENG